VSDLFSYTVRESARAKRVRLRMSRHHGLEVVIPRGYDRRRILQLLEHHSRWIERATERMRHERELSPPEPADGRPRSVSLQAVGEEWVVEYHLTDSARVSTRECDGRLVFYGDVGDRDACWAALRRWLMRTARKRLLPWLESVAEERGLSFERSSVRMPNSVTRCTTITRNDSEI